ncbi:Gtr1/RagA G protein conserved region-domain-containing protein [Zopfochytrium polystomum]|nr:Gtr1/RagA G protein conserved region-domain-containing protein [Zopfochytrium polystomum]
MKKKVLLMGRSGSGKTSMRSIIFANYIARDARRLAATIDVEYNQVRFLNNLVLNLWDCGGQEVFMESYITSQRDHMFRNVEVLIFVFDVESRDTEKDLYYYQNCIESIMNNSKDAKVFCLIHKMDLMPENSRLELFRTREMDLKRRSQPLSVTCFPTSIWDETLYRAWSAIVYSLIPNVKHLESHLENFRQICDAEEIVLFERTTFLVICQASSASASTGKQDGAVVPTASTAATGLQLDTHRFEKISNIIKNFKLSCSRTQAQFQSMEVRGKGFAAFVDVLTPNMFAMVIMSDLTVQSAATLLNIGSARKHFEKIEQGQFSR